jgi:hypothetical protein
VRTVPAGPWARLRALIALSWMEVMYRVSLSLSVPLRRSIQKPSVG